MSISIVCNAASHKVWEVRKFRHHPVFDGDTQAGWVEVPRYTRAERRALEKQRRTPRPPLPADATRIEQIIATMPPQPQSPTGAAELSGDRLLPPFVAVTMGPRVRHRNSLRCDQCDDSVPARREKLDPILDRLAEEGHKSISLSLLRTML